MGMIKLPKESINFFKENLDEIFKSGNLAEGEWNETLAKFIINLTGATNALPTNSNGAGIVSLLTIYRYYHGRNKVLIQSNTMYGVKTMVSAAGSKVSGFINCQLETLMPSIEDVKNVISQLNKADKKTLIILLSHIGGIINPDIKLIAQLCKDENIILLEDCAHSFASTLDGKHSGLFGDAGVYSFYATKAIPVGEGGIILTKNNKIGDMTKSFSMYDRFEQKLEVANNIRISEVQALLAYSVIKEWKQIIDDKKNIAEKYMDILKEKGIKYISQNEDGNLGNYYKFIIYNNKNIHDVYPMIKTMTSPVYDYSIGIPNQVAKNHACLPIWYAQENNITEKVLEELSLVI